MILKRLRISLLLNTILILFCSSLGHASSNSALDDLLPKESASKKKVFSCPKMLKREQLIQLLKAEYKEIPSRTGSSLPDKVAKTVEIEPGLWAAHKMTDTTRLSELLKHDTQMLITVLLDADESRPKGTLGEEFDSLIGTYLFYQKKTSTDTKLIPLPNYSLVVAFYKEKP